MLLWFCPLIFIVWQLPIADSDYSKRIRLIKTHFTQSLLHLYVKGSSITHSTPLCIIRITLTKLPIIGKLEVDFNPTKSFCLSRPKTAGI